jgi:WD40 repeat protein
MMAKQPAERPATMTELIALLESCKASAAEARAAAGEPPKSRPELKVFDEPLKRAAPAKTKAEPSIFTVLDKTEGLRINEDLRLEDLVMDVRPETPPAPVPASRGTPRPAADKPRRATPSPSSRRRQHTGAVLAAVGAIALLGIILARFTLFTGTDGPRPQAPLESAGANAPVPTSNFVSSESRDTRTIVLKTPLSSSGPDSTISIAGRNSASTLAQPAILPEPYVETARFIGHTHSLVEQVRLLPDGKTLLTACQDGTVRLWDLKTGREIRRLWHPAGVRAAVVLPDGRRAVTGCNDGFVRLWDLQKGQELRRLAKHAGMALAVTVSADGRTVFSGGDEPFLRLSDVETQVEVPKVEWQSPAVWSLAISGDGQRLLSGSTDGIVRLGDVKSGAPLSRLEQHSRWAFGVAFAPDDRRAVSSCIGQLVLWDLGAKKAVRQTNLEDRQLAAIALADSHHVVFCSHFKRADDGFTNEGLIGTWDFESDDPPRIVHRGPPGHLSLALLPNGGIATGDVDGLARIWEPSRSIAHARELVAAGKKVDAIPEYGQAITKRPDDARLLIERGRLLAELGRASEADADFTRAAQLAPDNPQLFVDAGWWIAGPYPPNFEWAIESDSATDRSKPPPPSGKEPRRWQRVPTKASGLVDMTPEFASFDKNVAGYAMTTVYSATERQAVLLIGTNDLGRVWLNGRQVLDSSKYTPPGANPVEVTLRGGSNMIVARVVNTVQEHELYLRISDKPWDFLYAHVERESWEGATKDYARALAEDPGILDTWFHHRGASSLARTRRWKEAIPAYRRSIDLNPGFFWNWYDLAKCELTLNDLPSYRRTCRAMVEKFAGTKNPADANNVAWVAAWAPDALPDYRKVLNMMKPLINAKNAWWGNLNTYGAVLYRDGQYQGAISYLKQSIEAQKGKGSAADWVFIAMARHRLRQPGDKDALARAKALAGTTSHSWNQIEIDHLLEEARQELALPPPR